MDYTKHYNKLIERANDRNLNVYTESHHIIPRCMGGSDSNDNLVILTPEEHYVAHQLLVKMYPYNHSILKAATMMVPNRPSNKMYGWLRRRLSATMSLSQRGTGNSQYGTKWIFNENERRSKKIPVVDDVPKGWCLGRKINFNKPKCTTCNVEVARKTQKYCDTCRHIAQSTAGKNQNKFVKHKSEFIEYYNNGQFENYSKTIEYFGYHPCNASINKIIKNWIEEILPR